MTIILLDPINYDKSIKNIIEKHSNVKVIHTIFSGIEESYPVVFRVPEGSFYGHVSTERLSDVIAGHADDLKIQTARFFTVEMKKFISEEKYRLMVIDFFDYLKGINPINSDNVSIEINNFCKEFDYMEQEVTDSLKMALIKTTKGPLLCDLIEAFGKKETKNRLSVYLNKYKYRF